MEDKKYWIWLSRIEGLGSIRIKQLLQKYNDPQIIWNLDKKEIMSVSGIGEGLAKKILQKEYRENLDLYIKYMEKYKIDIITIKDDIYPKNLKKIYDPPQVLYLKGNKDILNNGGISIVGCRDCSLYGKETCLNLSYELASRNINVISGMAKGIDTYAHMGCINAGGKTIAVIGSGIDRIYPKENEKLFYNIEKTGGLIVSEYILGTKPNKMNFPARNRIISGLSDGILVIEAKEKSGTLITIDFGLEQGKNIFVVPGNITSPNSVGTNELIKQGAKCVTNINDILEEYN